MSDEWSNDEETVESKRKQLLGLRHEISVYFKDWFADEWDDIDDWVQCMLIEDDNTLSQFNFDGPTEQKVMALIREAQGRHEELKNMRLKGKVI
jgi:hypothetical protein